MDWGLVKKKKKLLDPNQNNFKKSLQVWVFELFQFTQFCSKTAIFVIGSPKDQLPTACLCNRNAYSPRAIRTYIFSLLQTGYQTCAPRTMIKDFADSLLSVQKRLQ